MLAKLLDNLFIFLKVINCLYCQHLWFYTRKTRSTSAHPKYEASTIVMFAKQRKMFCSEFTDGENFWLRYRLQLKLGQCVPLSFLQ